MVDGNEQSERIRQLFKEKLFVEGNSDDTDIIDSKTARLQVTNGDQRLLLVTCYPFDTLATGGPMRYLVTAKRAI